MKIKVNLVKVFGYRSGDFSVYIIYLWIQYIWLQKYKLPRYLVIEYNKLADTAYFIIEIWASKIFGYRI